MASPLIELGELAFLNGPTPASFSFIFSLFNQNPNFTTNQCENVNSSIWRWDSNSRPSDYESPPSLRPGEISLTTWRTDGSQLCVVLQEVFVQLCLNVLAVGVLSERCAVRPNG